MNDSISFFLLAKSEYLDFIFYEIKNFVSVNNKILIDGAFQNKNDTNEQKKYVGHRISHFTKVPMTILCVCV